MIDTSIFQPFTDKTGLIHTSMVDSAGDASDQNGLCFTGEAVLYTKLSCGAFDNMGPAWIQNCLAGIKACQVQPGLYNAVPTNSRIETWDDYVGLAGFSAATNNPEIAKDILSYGRKNRKWKILPYFYDNTNPSNPAWSTCFLLRYQELICALEWAADEKPCFFNRFYFAASLLFQAYFSTTSQDGWRLSWDLIQTRHLANGKSWMCNLAEKIWWRKLNKMWGSTGMLAVWKAYSSGSPFAQVAQNFEPYYG
jgi:hypothetical protein